MIAGAELNSACLRFRHQESMMCFLNASTTSLENAADTLRILHDPSCEYHKCLVFFFPIPPSPRPKQEPVKCTRHKGSPEQLSAPQQACSLLSAYLGQDTAAVTTAFSLPVRVCVTCTDSALVKWCAASDAAENV